MLPSATGPIVASITVTPSDSTLFSRPTRAIYVGVTGNVTIQWAAANTESFLTSEGYSNTGAFVAVPAGTTLTVRANKVLATGTTANSILALF